MTPNTMINFYGFDMSQFQTFSFAAALFCGASLIAAGCTSETKPDVESKTTQPELQTDAKKPSATHSGDVNKRDRNTIRFASFNMALNRGGDGELLKELQSGESKSAAKLAEVIQIVRPDVLLLNEVDYSDGEAIVAFQEKFLAVPQNGQQPISFAHRFVAESNTGIDSGVDLNGDGKLSEPDDAFGYGAFPGQYAMAVLSNQKIDTEKVRTFQKFLWKDMPSAMWPVNPETKEPWYSDDAKEIFRLSSKSHWDLPIVVGNTSIHFLVSHPTPPVFDGDEDRNGKRNHDEIRIWSDYINGSADYLYDDNGGTGGLADDAKFVIAGDLNADPNDGDSTDGAIRQLTTHARINNDFIPRSTGGESYAVEQAGANAEHVGDPANDTGDFNDRSVGNVRIDYVLPSKNLTVTNSGVFWPAADEPDGKLADASDHHLIWIDVVRP